MSVEGSPPPGNTGGGGTPPGGDFPPPPEDRPGNGQVRHAGGTTPKKADLARAEAPPTAADAWARRAEELAPWAWERLVNRTDVWGGYVPREERGKEYRRADGTTGTLGKSYTRPAVSQRGKVHLTDRVLARHFRARDGGKVVGLHTTSPENTSRWGAVEFDAHSDEDHPEANLAAALAGHDSLAARGFRPLLTQSDDRGGYHLRLILSEPAETPRVFALLQDLAAECARHGLAKPPECFPKQASIEAGRFGNWLRLPGRHHTREHWARVWDGDRWLDGDEAIDFMLALTGDSSNLVPKVLDAEPIASAPTAISSLRGEAWSGRRGRARLLAQDELVVEGRRDTLLTSLAGTMRWRGFTREASAAALLEMNAASCRPPLSDDQVAKIATSVAGYPPAADDLPEADSHLTDLGNARRLVRIHGRDLRYCHPAKRWLVWDGRRWCHDDTAAVERLAKSTVEGLLSWATGRLQHLLDQRGTTA